MQQNDNGKRKRFHRIIAYLGRYKKYLFWGGLAVIFSNSLMLINPYLLKTAFDRLEKGAVPSTIFPIAVAIVVLALLSAVFRFSMRRTIIWMSRKVEYDLRVDFFSHLLTLNPTFYHNTKTGDIMARSTNDIEAVRMMVGPGIMHIGNAFVSAVIAISFMVYLSPELAALSLLPLPALAVVVNRLGTLVHRRFSKIQEYFSVLTAVVQENLSGIRVIRAYSQENNEISKFGDHNKEYVRLNMRMIKINALFFPILFFLAGTVSLFVLYFGGRAVINDSITLGTLVAFFAYLSLLIWPMIALGWVVSLYQRGTASLDRLNKIFNTKPEVGNSVSAKTDIKLKGKIQFRNLDFAYNGTKILHNINLTIEPGMSVGIIGPTASGKTTLVSLISRLFPVEIGKLFIDDIDINDIDLKTLRAQIGFVPQEPFLFSDTLTNNILFAGREHDVKLARDVAARAVIDKEIEEFANGYETMLGERGITLSGGQKQRVALARALVINPPIIILDDATSAVDTETEHLINLSLRDELNKRTAIIISHRASAVKDADIIVYLEDGSIAESGDHEQLMALNGRYARLYRTQLIEEELKRL